MPTTPIYALPYPAAADPADVPLDMQELAERTEAVLNPLAYVENAANVTVTATTAAGAQTIVSAGAVTYEAKPILIEFWAPHARPPAVVGAEMILNLWDASTDLGIIGHFFSPAAAISGGPAALARRLTPTAGSHTYIIKGWVSTGSGGVFGAAGYMPQFIRVARG